MNRFHNIGSGAYGPICGSIQRHIWSYSYTIQKIDLKQQIVVPYFEATSTYQTRVRQLRFNCTEQRLLPKRSSAQYSNYMKLHEVLSTNFVIKYRAVQFVCRVRKCRVPDNTTPNSDCWLLTPLEINTKLHELRSNLVQKMWKLEILGIEGFYIYTDTWHSIIWVNKVNQYFAYESINNLIDSPLSW